MGHPKDVHFPVVLRAHVFEKVRAIDMTLAEFEDDDERAEERIVTVHEPHPDSWSNDYRRRR